VANDGLLGQGAYRAGHRATELIPGTDRGTAVVKGFTGARSEILQWYFLSVDEGNDVVSPLIARAMDAIGRRGKGLPGAGRPAPTTEKAVDPLADIAEVLAGEKRMRTVELLSRLGEHNRDAYGGWDAGKLTAVLAAEHIRTVKVQGVMCVRAADIHERLADRLLDTDHPDTDPDSDPGTGPDTDGDDEGIEDANDR
jgi:S-DNA-T family DNA segregation ATPase FtsK/SpoIIIE